MEYFGLEYFQSAGPIFLLALTVWSLVWKGLALWKSARGNQRNWFIVILIVNTVGLVEILYIFVFSDKNAKIYSYLAKLRQKLPF